MDITAIKINKPRYQLIDAARGLSIILMVFYHFGFDLYLYCGLPDRVMFNPVLNALWFFFASLFIFMSGASSLMSRSNIKRGLKILAAALAITVVTYLFDPEIFIKFGILHFLGCCALIYALLRPLLDKIPLAMQPVIYIALYFLTRYATRAEVESEWLFMFGFTAPGFTSGDYFPLLPWIFIYLLGTWFGRLVVARRLPGWFYTFDMPFLPAVGRRTLWVYVAHQPVLMGIVYVILYFQGK